MREKVFLAGTDDVKYIMESLEKELKEMSYDPIWFHRKFNVDSKDTMKTCLDNVKTSDRLILVLDKKCGLPYRDAPRSITEEEFLTAYKDNKPILIFLNQETYAHSKIYRKRIKLGDIITEDNKNEYGFKADIELFDFIDGIQHLERDGKLDIRWRELYDSIKDIVDQIKLKWVVPTKNMDIDFQEYNFIESKKFQKPHHSDQQKWQEFYNRMANTDPKHLGIDIQYLHNNKIYESDFEKVLKMNVGANDKYLKIYSNQEWYFSFINRRMGGDYYEIFVRNENTQQTYDFFNPSVNEVILKEWIDYIVEYCAIAGIKIKR